MTIESYRDLRVWQEAMDLAEACYQLTARFPREEVYGLTSQIRRASVSGSLKELETHILLAGRLSLIDPQLGDPVLANCDAIGRMLLGLIRQLERKD